MSRRGSVQLESSDIDYEQLRKATLSQVRELRELKQSLEGERRRAQLLEEENKRLRALLAAHDIDASSIVSLSSSVSTGLSVSPRAGSGALPSVSPRNTTSLSTSTLSPAINRAVSPGLPRAASTASAARVQQTTGAASPSPLQRKGLNNNNNNNNSVSGSSNSILGRSVSLVSYSTLAQVLRLLDRADVLRCACTCRAWRVHCSAFVAEARRFRLAHELCSTERTFLFNLRDAVERYIWPGAVGTKVLDSEETFRLFANIEDLSQLSGRLYRSLHELVFTWSPATSCVSSVFESFKDAPQFYRIYSANQTEALAFAEQLRFELRIADADWRRLESLLIQPIQRVPRYLLLLREIAQHTPEGHPEHAQLKGAVDLLSEVGKEMERGMEEQSIASFGKEVLGLVSELPAWLSSSPPRVLRFADAKRSDGVGSLARKKQLECFVLLFESKLLVVDFRGIRRDLKKDAAAPSAASVASPLGKGSDALKKTWGFACEFERDKILLSTVSDVALGVCTNDSNATTIVFATPQEAMAWKDLLNIHGKPLF